MKLVKLQDLSNRPITSSELMTRYIFGDRFPNKFEPTKFYNAGDYVYAGDKNGQVTIYYCIKNGSYSTITSEGWIVATIPSLVKEHFDQLIADIDIPVGDGTLDECQQTYVPSMNDYEYKTYINEDLTFNGNDVILPFKYNSHLHDIEVYKNRTRLFEVDSDFSIYGKTLSFKDTVTNADDLVINVLHKSTPGSRLIYSTQRHASVVKTYSTDTSLTVIEVNLDKKYLDKSLIFNMYRLGKYISEADYKFYYDFDNSKYVIETSISGSKYWNKNDITFDFMFSLSKEVSIVKHDIRRSVQPNGNKFKLDMKYTDFNDVSKIYNCYDGNDIIPNTATTLYNDCVHITESKYQAKTYDFTLSYILLVFTSVHDTDTDESNDYYDYIHLPDECYNEGKIPVPFTKFNRTNSDMIIFKNAGIFISPHRYFVDENNVLTFMDNDSSLHKDDVIKFRLFDNDYSIHTYTKYVTIDKDTIESGFRLPVLDFNTECFDLMIFHESGAYIASNKYTLKNNVVKFTPDSGITETDRICILMLEYCLNRTSTVMKRFTTLPTSHKTAILPFIYNKSTDNVIILTEDGVYLDETRYTLNANGVVELVSGSDFDTSKILDIFVFRHLDDTKLIIQVPDIRNNLL